MESKKVLLFDFDGTLVDSLLLIKQIINDLSVKYKYKKITEDDFEQLRAKDPKEVLQSLEVSKLKIPFIALDLKSAFQKNLVNVSWVKGMKETLETLAAKGFVLGILTSNGKENVETFLEMHHINCIDFVYGDVGIFGKSSSIEKVLKKNNIPKQDVFYIGDEIRDIQACKKVGIKIISVCWGFNSEEVLRNASPDYIVREPKDILDIVNK